MQTTLSQKKILDTFAGELYYLNQDEIQECLEQKTKPDYHCIYTFPKLSLIEDQRNGVIYLLGDFEGTREYYNYTIKIFLYPKEGKALGSITYIADAKLPVLKLTAQFIKSKDGYIIHGYITTPGAEGKEGFMVYAEKPALKEILAPVVKQQKAVPAKTDIMRLRKNKTQKKAKHEPPAQQLINRAAIKEADQTPAENTINDYFGPLEAEAEKSACIHFVAYVLMKTGYKVERLQNKELADLMLEYNGHYYFIHVHASRKATPTWRVNIKEVRQEHFHIFCHVLPDEFVPDLYIVEEAQVVKGMKKKGAISIDDKEMVNIKNSWNPLLE